MICTLIGQTSDAGRKSLDYWFNYFNSLIYNIYLFNCKYFV